MTDKPKVLVIDDEMITREALQMSLEDSFEIAVAESAEEAMQLLGTFKPSVILCDYAMPKKNGIDFYNEIRLKGDKTPVIILSAVADVVRKKKESISNADFLIMDKPWELNSLEKELKTLAEFQLHS